MHRMKSSTMVLLGLANSALFAILFVVGGTYGPVRWMGFALGTGLVLTIVGFVRWWREPAGTDTTRVRVRKIRLLVGSILFVALVAAALTTYALSTIESAEFYCHKVSVAATMSERERAWVTAQQRWAKARTFDAMHLCQGAVSDRKRYAQGKCPFIPADDGPCDCHGQQWPDDWKQPTPAKCVTGKGLVEDTWPEGRKDRWFLPWPP